MRREASPARLVVTLLAVCVIGSACHTGAPGAAGSLATTTPQPATSAGASPSSSPAFGPLTCTSVSGTLTAPGLAVLQGVTATAHPGYDALVFTFASLTAPPVPAGVSATYQVAPASPPFTADPSGKPLAVKGSSFLKIAFHGAYGYDPVNVPPQVSYHGPADLTPPLTTLMEAREAGDFEGYLTWIVGLSRQACWRVVRAASPPAFELDVPA